MLTPQKTGFRFQIGRVGRLICKMTCSHYLHRTGLSKKSQGRRKISLIFRVNRVITYPNTTWHYSVLKGIRALVQRLFEANWMRFAPVTRLIERQVLFLLVRPLGLGTGTALTSLRIMGHKYMTTCAERGRDRTHAFAVFFFFSLQFPDFPINRHSKRWSNLSRFIIKYNANNK